MIHFPFLLFPPHRVLCPLGFSRRGAYALINCTLHATHLHSPLLALSVPFRIPFFLVLQPVVLPLPPTPAHLTT